MKKGLASLLLFFAVCVSQSLAIERRGPQFETEPSYLIFPLPYSIAGIGQGVVVTGLAGNIANTNVDAYALGIFGDAVGKMLAIEDIHLLPELLILDMSRQDIDRAAVNFYDKRGMDSKKEDYNLVEVDDVISDYAKLTLSLLDRRLELYGILYKQEVHVIKISDSEGRILSDLDFTGKEERRSFGFLVDYTDDRKDPKRGVRFGAERSSSPSHAYPDPEFYTIDTSLSFYLPVTKEATWAFNFFHSDAYVTKKGETDPDKIRSEFNFNCPPLNSECLKAEQDVVNNYVAIRSNGTATALGGENRLRSYPGSRYIGAHSYYYATELRWNISEEVRPFDFGIWKDVATGLQVALFYETGSVSETIRELGDITRSSYGGGFRLVSASGYVYRADFASGEEGEELTVIFSYPW